jgi:hypothetical protein
MRSSRRKPLAVFRRRRVHIALEAHAHALFRAEAALARDLVEPRFGLFQHAPRRLDAEQFDRLAGRAAGLFLVHAGEIAGAHARAFGHALDIQAAVVQVFHDPCMQLVEGRVVARLGAQQFAVLGLAAGTLHEHHQFARDIHRHRPAAILFDQRQRQVDAGGDAGRGPDAVLASRRWPRGRRRAH